jgi:uncharacterized protein (DUF1499 family)
MLTTSPPAAAALFGDLFAGTPPATLGATAGRLAPCPDRPNCAASQATDSAHRVAPIAFAGDAAAAMARLQRVVAAQPGAVVVVARGDYLYATFRSAVFGFVDDVEFLANPAAGAIDVRSASRLGHSDFGVNRKRVEAVRAAFAMESP